MPSLAWPWIFLFMNIDIYYWYGQGYLSLRQYRKVFYQVAWIKLILWCWFESVKNKIALQRGFDFAQSGKQAGKFACLSIKFAHFLLFAEITDWCQSVAFNLTKESMQIEFLGLNNRIPMQIPSVHYEPKLPASRK